MMLLTMKKLKNIIIVIVGFLIAVSCEKEEKIQLDPNTDIVLFDHVKIIKDDDFEQYIINIDSVSFTLQSSSEMIGNYGLQAGDILVSSVGYGLLRVLDSIDISGEYAFLYTSQATLEEVIEHGYISYQHMLSLQLIEHMEYMVDGVKLSYTSFDKDNTSLDFEFNVDLGSYVALAGDLSVTSEVLFELDISRFLRLRKVHFGFENNTQSTVTLTAGSSFSINSGIRIARVYFTPIVIPTIIPIVITPILDIDVGLDGSSEASVSISTGQHFQYETGVVFERGDGWRNYSNTSNDWHFNPPLVTMEASAQAYIQPEMSMLLYGVLGAYMDTRLYGEIEVLPLESPWWYLYTGYRVGLGAKAAILGFDLFDVDYPELIANKWLIADSGDDQPGQLGTINGMVNDAVSQNPLAGVNVSAYQGASLINSTQTDASGNYLLQLSEGGNYNIEFFKSGYLPVNYNNVAVVEDEVTYLKEVIPIDEAFSGDGIISEIIRDAFDGQGISGADNLVREGVNTQEGPLVASLISESNGTYSISNIAGGNYTLEVSKNQHQTAYSSVISIGEQNTTNQNVTLTPNIADDEIPVIRDWRATPADLDAHLTGPVPGSSNRFHVFFANQQFYHNSELYAALDYDVVNGYGPETVTIYQQTNGVYRYSVHDYTNRLSTTSKALSASNARVRLYAGNQLLNTFHVHGNTHGTLWTVFEMDGNNIMPVNEMTFESNPGTVTKKTRMNGLQVRFISCRNKTS